MLERRATALHEEVVEDISTCTTTVCVTLETSLTLDARREERGAGGAGGAIGAPQPASTEPPRIAFFNHSKTLVATVNSVYAIFGTNLEPYCEFGMR